MKKRDLLVLLKDLDDEAEVVVAATPHVTGYVQDIVPTLRRCQDGAQEHVLCLTEETVGEEERRF